MIFQLTGVSIVTIVYFVIGWCLSYKLNKYSWVDFFWSSSFLIIIAILVPQNPSPPVIAISVLFALWSLRLSGLLLKRICKENEDSRYVLIKKRWGTRSPLYFLFLYIFEGFLALLLSLPIYLNTSSDVVHITFWNVLGVGLFSLALMGEVTSDQQLQAFKINNRGQKKVCDKGLWKYSRHPNYFFEILIWFSYGIFGLSLESPLLSFIPFVVMYFLITKVTGIPYAEQQAIVSRGDLYREYQRTTNVLFPWFPKENGK